MSTDKYRVEFTVEAQDDLRDLDGASRKKVAKAIMKKLAVAPSEYGLPLGARNAGNLTGLRKLVVGDRQLRIIYEVLEDHSVVVLWVIGDRSDDECYSMAYARIPQIGSPQHQNRLRQILDIFSGK